MKKHSISSSVDEELLEVSIFLNFFADELKLGICPEQAYKGALGKYTGPLKTLFMKGARQLFIEAVPLENVLKGLANRLNSVNSKYLLQLSCKFVEKDSMAAGKTLQAMVTTLEENISLIKKRGHLVRAKNVKTKILSLATSLVLGYMAALTPLFSLVFLVRQNQIGAIPPSLTFNAISYWPAIVSFFFIGLITTYQLTEFTKGESPWPLLFVSALLFIITYLLTHSLVTTLMW